LTAHIAIIDRHGVITAVNQAWVEFADDNNGSLPNHGIGLNYITLCDPEAGQQVANTTADDYGVQAAQGIRAVLAGRQNRFQLTYPCHSPTEQRWFMLTVTPLDSIEITQGAIVAHENVTTLVQREEAISSALVSTVEAIADIAETRDPYTAGHQRATAQLAVAIAREMYLDDATCQTIHLAASIHDIGKMAIPAEILARPGRLSDVEMQLVRSHCQAGRDMLANISFPWPLADIVVQHHERLDGSGYPAGLAGDQIRLEARVIAVADVVDAISSHRPYRPSRGPGVAIQELRQGTGTLYDTAVVDAFLTPKVQELVSRLYGAGEDLHQPG
jgi:putative nucleotidyltransferase with HDIG domain